MKSVVSKRVISENRKIRKPLMEKKRRARINDSLETLKQILLDSKIAFCNEASPITTNENANATQQQQNKTAKLEKADILEMTVRYVQQLRTKLVANRLANYPSINNKKEQKVAIRAADSSSTCPAASAEQKVKITFVPARLKTGEIVYVMPTSLENCQRKEENGSINRVVPMVAKNVWRPW